MFGFITKKYKDRIKQLENQIEFMAYEWTQEKQLYGKKTKERFIKQKVDWVVGGIELNPGKEIHRPMYGLTQSEAEEIRDATECHLNKLGFKVQVEFHWKKTESCFVIDVKIMDPR